jgi:Fe-S oxidoreductase
MTETKALDTFLAQVDAAMASYLESCVHCGQCAEACHFYAVTGDPKLTPTYKLFPMVKMYKRHKAPFAGLMRALGLAPAPVTDDELAEWETLIYDTCTMCGRCTLVCPMGIDIAGALRKVRQGMVAAGRVPEGLTAAAERHLDRGSPLGIRPESFRRIVQEQADEVGIPIELDREGADYMVILSAMELINFNETIGALARLFKAADVSWTMSSTAYEATNVGIQMGSRDVASTLVQRIVDAAEKLKVKYVISPECGHAYSALKWEGPNLVGKAYDFEVVHILELLDQLRRDGKIKLKDKDTRRLTFHDPCQIVRRGGIVREPRDLVRHAADNFHEMPYAGIANICCGGGGGVSSNARAEELKIKAFECKKAQIEAVGDVAVLVTACANCRNTLEESIDAYEMELPVIGVAELLAEHLDDGIEVERL